GRKPMQPAIREALDSIFGGADEIVGSHAPYAFEAERRYVADVREAVEEALGRLPAPVLGALGMRLAAIAVIRDRTIEADEAFWNRTPMNRLTLLTFLATSFVARSLRGDTPELPTYTYVISAPSHQEAGVFMSAVHLRIPDTVWLC